MAGTALITGGTRGIGLAIATHLAREGFDLALNGMRAESEVAETLRSLSETGRRVVYFPGNIGDRGFRDTLMDGVRETFGSLHVLVNNAGMAPRARLDLLEATEESFAEVLQVNLQAPYFLTQATARWMKEQKQADPEFRGCIINIGSVSATIASVNRGEYCIAKAGMAMATRLWAARLGQEGIPVYEIRPGITQTDMTAGVREKYDRLIEQGLLVQPRWGMPDDVGRAAAMLARGDLPYSTGQVILIDGGLTLPRL